MRAILVDWLVEVHLKFKVFSKPAAGDSIAAGLGLHKNIRIAPVSDICNHLCWCFAAHA
jgi:hypothetical protein